MLLNAVDASYRSEFRELFEAHFGQVRAEMAGLRAETRSEMAALGARLESEMAALRARLESEMTAVRTELRAEFKTEGAGLRGEIAGLDRRLEKQKSELLIWMFLFWITTVGAVLLKGNL